MDLNLETIFERRDKRPNKLEIITSNIRSPTLLSNIPNSCFPIKGLGK
jgi:hypothetical protein